MFAQAVTMGGILVGVTHSDGHRIANDALPRALVAGVIVLAMRRNRSPLGTNEGSSAL